MTEDEDRDFEEFIKKHPEWAQPGSSIEKQKEVYKSVRVQQLQQKADAAENRKKANQALDHAVEKKNQGKQEDIDPHTSGPDEREIIVGNQRLWELTEHALIALQEKNNPPIIFIRAGGLVRIRRDEKGTPSLEICNPDILKYILERSAGFYKLRGDASKKVISPPSEVVKDILATTDWSRFPAIEGIVEAPVILSDGTITTSPGYYSDLRMLYHPSPDLQLPYISDRPGQLEIMEAVNLLNEIFIDFPFENEASRTNVIAALITAVLRPVIPGVLPMALIDKPQQGAGSGLMTDVIALVATGREAAKMTIPPDETEWRKLITAGLAQGQGFFVFDNVDKPLISPSLASVLTSSIWKDRVLGVSAMIDLTNHSMFIANGINVETKLDIARRVYWIRIDPKMACPDQRTDFLHEELLPWVKSERGRILAAILTLTRAWMQAGSPLPTGCPQMGGFEKWRGMIGGILENAKISGFLGNLKMFRERSDTLTSEWDSFLQALKEQFPGSFTVKDVKARLEAYNDDRQSSFNDPMVRLCEVLPSDIPLKDKDPSRAIGKAFGKKADHVFPSGVVLRKESTRTHNVVAWRVENQNEKKK